MSKVKQMESKSNKISQEHLEKIQDQQNKITQLLRQIGFIENEKHQLLHEYAGVLKEVEEFKPELEKEYGAVNIDISTGEYTAIEQEEKQD